MELVKSQIFSDLLQYLKLFTQLFYCTKCFAVELEIPCATPFFLCKFIVTPHSGDPRQVQSAIRPRTFSLESSEL